MSAAFPDAVVPDDYIVGSNNWAVAGANAASGHPLLCNDPHLNLTLPSIWFQLQIHTPEQNCYGVSLQGIPGIIIGFNEEIAWGVTNVGHDVSDWYRLQWANRLDSLERHLARTSPRIDPAPTDPTTKEPT